MTLESLTNTVSASSNPSITVLLSSGKVFKQHALGRGFSPGSTWFPPHPKYTSNFERNVIISVPLVHKIMWLCIFAKSLFTNSAQSRDKSLRQ